MRPSAAPLTLTHLDPPLISRRRFTTVLALAATVPFARAAAATSSAQAQPRIGVQTTISLAPQVKAAGGEFIAESLAGFIRPDDSEADFQRTLEIVRQAPLPIWACNFFIGRRDLRCTGPDANHDAVLTYAQNAFDKAARAGVRSITFGSSGSRSLPAGFDQQVGQDQFVALLRRMGPLAADHGIVVAVESLQRRECNFLTRITEVGQVVRRVDHPAIRAAADLYHIVAEAETPEDLASVLDVVTHVELAEVEGRRIPGTSGQDFRPYFRVLKDGNYRGLLCFEGKFEPAELPAGLATIARQWQEA
jgi:sugar phosphate isomerase/epimerase